VINGIDSFYCDGKNYTAGSNQLVLINPGEVHTGNTVSDIPLVYFSLYPGVEELRQVADALNIHLPAHFCFQRSLIDQSLLAKKFSALFAAIDRKAPGLAQQELFFDCMHGLLGPLTTGHSCQEDCDVKDARIRLLIDFIRANYKEEISLQQMAKLVSLNPFHLTRLFKRIVGVSVYEYLLIIRTEEARRLLRKGARVQDASREAGFYDSSHFNRMFRKMAGTSPKSFRSSKSQYRTSFAG
jgi:AraC-like DNA-binding protein